MSRSVVLFHTISAALRAEKLLLATGWPIQLIPTPRQFSSDCGVALRFETVRRPEVERRLAEARLDVELRDLPGPE